MKVQPFQVPKLLNENLIVQVDRAQAFYNNLHQHNEIQLSLILKGNGKLLIGDSIHPFSNGDFFVIGPNSPHVFKTENIEGKVHMISLFFTKDTFGEDFFQLSDLEEINSFFVLAQDGFQLLSNQQEVRQLMIQFNKISKFSRVITFLKLLALLCKSNKRALTNFIYPKATGHLAGERMQLVFDYALHNFHNEIKLNTISDLVYMTPNAFCKFFKQRTNKTFFQFLIELRIEHACQLLQKNGDQSIATIAEQSGFKSISNFNRKFRSYKNMIPSQYRKKLAQIKIVPSLS